METTLLIFSKMAKYFSIILFIFATFLLIILNNNSNHEIFNSVENETSKGEVNKSSKIWWLMPLYFFSPKTRWWICLIIIMLIYLLSIVLLSQRKFQKGQIPSKTRCDYEELKHARKIKEYNIKIVNLNQKLKKLINNFKNSEIASRKQLYPEIINLQNYINKIKETNKYIITEKKEWEDACNEQPVFPDVPSSSSSVEKPSW